MTTIPKDHIKEDAEAHWSYIESLLEAHGHTDLAAIKFHYVSAFTHGFKHGVEWIEDDNN